jgi:rhodanese-related sulfurtransferase
MSGDKRFVCHGAVLAVMMAVVPGSAPAQSGDFGGSFEAGAGAGGAQPVPEPAPPAGGEDQFGGSFGGEAGAGQEAPATPRPAPPAPATEAPAPAAGGAVEGEAFDPGFGLPGEGQAPPPGPGAAPPPPEGSAAPAAIRIDPQITAFELRDFGVPPIAQLWPGPFAAPTPTSLPGGYLVTTEQLANAINQGMALVLVDVYGATYDIPGSFVATPMGGPGTFFDAVQQQTVAWLFQITGGNPAQALVFYCSDPGCWLGYNAALRAVAAGYTNVYWYRGGLQAWQMSGLPLVPSGF